jgi:FkbM family methyltransferase
MKKLLLTIYQAIFCRQAFYRFHQLLHLLSLHGLGYLNSQNFKISGEQWLLTNFLQNKSEAVVFDVGANVGDYSLLIKQNNHRARLYAFEPHPYNFQRLALAAKANDFQAYNLGFSNLAAESLLYDLKDGVNSELASVYSAVLNDLHHRDAVTYKVQLDTIDNFCAQEKISAIDLLKIDTEGHEYAVLQGAKAMLGDHKIKIIQFEFNEMNVVSRVFVKDFIDLLSAYRLFILLPDGLQEIFYTPVKVEIFGFCNIVAISKSACSDFKIN